MNNRFNRNVTRLVLGAIGLLHFVVMSFFYGGPELAGLVPYAVDYPAFAMLTSVFNCGNETALRLAIPICSIAYPLGLYLVIRVIRRVLRRPLPGHCRCNLTGNTSAFCPECGKQCRRAS